MLGTHAAGKTGLVKCLYVNQSKQVGDRGGMREHAKTRNCSAYELSDRINGSIILRCVCYNDKSSAGVAKR